MVGSRRLTAAVTQFVGSRPVVVALSGGADSAVLAWAATQAASTVRAVHVNHGTEHSHVLEQAAHRIGQELGISVRVVRVSVPSHGSFETAARKLRYRALLGTLQSDEMLLVGHTRDDQAETVLMRLARGAGPSGLGAMRPVRGSIVRPLLGFGRAEVRKTADDLGLAFVDDPSNVDPAHTRVVVRTEVMPVLERLQPGAVAAMARHAELAQRLDDHVERELSSVVEDGRVAFASYAVMEPIHRVRTLRRLVVSAGGRPPTAQALQRMHEVAGGERSSVEIEAGFELLRNGPFLEVQRACRVAPAPAELDSSGRIHWAGWAFEVATRDGRPPAWPIDLDRAVVPALGRITVRSLRRDDAFGSHPVVDELTRTPASIRHCWPAVEVAGTLVWVPGVRRGKAGWVGSEDRGYRWLAANREDAWRSERS